MKTVNQLLKAVILVVLLNLIYVHAHAQTVTSTYYHTDALGSIVAASDEQGDIIWKKTYDPYGNEVISTEDGDEFEGQAYTGKPYDEETGLVYLGQRYYDPEIKRFMGMDSVGFRADAPVSFNRYAYANNNPYKFIDPDGRQAMNAIYNFNSLTPAQRDGANAFINSRLGLLADFTPVLGDVKGIGEAISDPTPLNIIAAVVGFVPLAGDAASASMKAPKGGEDFFRGSRNGGAPDFTPRSNEFKVDKQTGLVKDTHGVSVFDNAKSVSDKGFTPNKIDQSTIPDSLRIIQRGNDPRHFEIVPKPGANLSPLEFSKACQSIKCGG